MPCNPKRAPAVVAHYRRALRGALISPGGKEREGLHSCTCLKGQLSQSKKDSPGGNKASSKGGHHVVSSLR
eukprot:205520-Pelagomonas_calceolata.AAC.1